MEFKICSKCGRKLPLTTEYFNKRKDSKDGFRGECKDCKSKFNKQYREANREHLKEYQKNYRADHKEEKKEYAKTYYPRYYTKNKNSITQKHIIYNRKYSKTEHGREIDRAKKHKRKALKWLNGGEYTPQEWKECLEFFGNKCAYTGQKLSDNATVDHIIPISKGGENSIWNICPSCGSANFSKCDNDMESWFRKQDYFSEERLNKIYAWIELAQLLY